MSTVKLVYRDGEDARSIKGEIIDEDNFFIKIRRSDGREFRINKSFIIKVESITEAVQ